ncbi:hypothetical protein Q4555_07965 [Octadecabacter sp. 1_MG-2023]|uniref:hypothetical protein n=1 Tax=unclassified Octadecabacter TaxID=196158 RepID=UPI001C09C15C|nr:MULTISPECIES: hypothetical protein [unclassified Octadecabacter]MBU2994110.1 hypothetical protein [Octadecabacter sp. B2R22]MDO6734601.1 hypothetical protein [Octadecabacter sp. 1_MG-2023]
MKDLFDTPTEPKTANPWAASVRIKSRTLSQAYGQRRHDFRVGMQPQYVDLSRANLNRVLLEPRPLPQIRDEIVELRERRGAQRAMKSNCAIVTAGIITFGREAAKQFNGLSIEQQDAAYLELAQALASHLNTRLEALVHHGDETASHAHFELRAFAGNGHPISKEMTRQGMSELQDMTAEILQRYCPDIERGHRKKDRLDAGADYPDTLNRSVRQLHEDLPSEIAVKEQEIQGLNADIAERQASIAKDQERVAKLEYKEVLQANEEKRLGKYRVRIAKKVVALKAVQSQQVEQRERLKQRQATLERAERKNAAKTEDLVKKTVAADTAIAQAEYAKADYEAGAAAVEAIVEEMANGTIQETAEEITLQNPEPIKVASKRVQKRLTTLVHRYLDLQLAWEKRTVWLNEMLGKMQNWLGRDDLSEGARSEGDRIEREYESWPEL